MLSSFSQLAEFLDKSYNFLNFSYCNCKIQEIILTSKYNCKNKDTVNLRVFCRYYLNYQHLISPFSNWLIKLSYPLYMPKALQCLLWNPWHSGELLSPKGFMSHCGINTHHAVKQGLTWVSPIKGKNYKLFIFITANE